MLIFGPILPKYTIPYCLCQPLTPLEGGGLNHPPITIFYTSSRYSMRLRFYMKALLRLRNSPPSPPSHHGRTNKGLTISAMVCTTWNYVCCGLTLIGDGMPGHFLSCSSQLTTSYFLCYIDGYSISSFSGKNGPKIQRKW